MPDDGWQGEWWQAEQDDDNKSCPEIPRQRVWIRAGKRGRGVVKGALRLIEEFPAVFAFHRLVLDFLGAIGALFHSYGWGGISIGFACAFINQERWMARKSIAVMFAGNDLIPVL